MARRPEHRSPLPDLLSLVLRLGRKCPASQDKVLRLIGLVGEIEAEIGPTGYERPDRLAFRLRHPLWDELTPDERILLQRAAEVVAAAARCDGAQAPPARPPLTAALVQEALASALGGDLTEDQLRRAAATVIAVARPARGGGPLPDSKH